MTARVLGGASVLALVLTACPATTETSPTPSPTPEAPSPTTVLDPTPTESEAAPPEPAVATQIAYLYTDPRPDGDPDAWDLWHYDVASDNATRLTDDGRTREESAPRFVDEDTVAYAIKGKIRAIDLSVAPPTTSTVVSHPSIAPRLLGEFDVSPDGTTFAWYRERFDPPTLRVFTFSEADGVEQIRTLSVEGSFGRGGADSDELRLTFSPDGSKLLLTYTPWDQVKKTMFVLDADTGGDVVPPRFGTFARWSHDSSTVFWGRWDDVSKWRTLDVGTGTVGILPGTGKMFHPSLSPDGEKLAFDDGAPKARAKVYDISTGTVTLVQKNLVAPLWLSGETLIASRTRVCLEADECFLGPPYAFTGKTASVAATGGAKTPTDPQITTHADVYYG